MSYPYRIAVLAVVLGVALLATSCGSSNPGSGVNPTGGTIDGGPPPLPQTSPPPIPTLVPITPAPGRRERVAKWRLADRSDDGRRLLVDVAIGGPPCDTVTVYAGRLASADCPNGTAGSLATARVEAKLTRPLADRELLGGAS